METKLNPVVCKESTKVENSLSFIQKGCCELTEVLSELTNKISSTLLPSSSEPEGSSDQEKTADEGSLVNSLNDINLKINDSISRVSELSRRCTL